MDTQTTNNVTNYEQYDKVSLGTRFGNSTVGKLLNAAKETLLLPFDALKLIFVRVFVRIAFPKEMR